MDGRVGEGTYFVAGNTSPEAIREALADFDIDVGLPIVKEGWDYEVEVLEPHRVEDVLERLRAVADRAEGIDEALKEFAFDSARETWDEHVARCEAAMR